jgi:hypothetical protein
MTHLARVPARAIVRAIADASDRWSDADFPPRVRATDRIVQRTGYSAPVVEYALDRLFFSMTQAQLEAVIRDEVGSLDALDGFVPRPERPDAWAAPGGRVCIISSRTTIGVALVPAVFALCAKCDVIVKDREDALIAAFFETLHEELDETGLGARASAWDAQALDRPELHAFDVVVAFGTTQTLAEIRAACAPDTRFVGFGSRASAGYVARESLHSVQRAAEIARGAARDVVLYETEGCLSLHVLFVERGAAVSVEAFGRALAEQIEAAGIEFPPGRRTPGEQSAVAAQRDLAAFRAADGHGAVFSNDAAEYAVLLEASPAQPPRFLPRTIGVLAVDDPAAAAEYIRNHRIPLEAFALSTNREDVLSMATAAGAVRLTRFGELQHPPLAGDHGGRPRIAEFVRWIDREL